MTANSPSLEIFNQTFQAANFGYGDHPGISDVFEGHVTALYDLAATRLRLPDTSYHTPLSPSPVAIKLAQSPLAELGTRPLELRDYQEACRASIEKVNNTDTTGAGVVLGGLHALSKLLRRGSRSEAYFPMIDEGGIALVSKIRFALLLYPDADLSLSTEQARVIQVTRTINKHRVPLVNLRLLKGSWANPNVPLQIKLREHVSSSIDSKNIEPCVTCPFYRNDNNGEPVCGILADCPEPTDRKVEASLICDQGKWGEYAVAVVVRRTAATRASKHERITPSLIPRDCLAKQINEAVGTRYMPRHIKLLSALQAATSRQ